MSVLFVSLYISRVAVLVASQIPKFLDPPLHAFNLLFNLFQYSMYFNYCFCQQPQNKRINYTYITDTAGRNVLVVGVILSAGSDSFTPTKLSLVVDVPYTGVYIAALRFMVSG